MPARMSDNDQPRKVVSISAGIAVTSQSTVSKRSGDATKRAVYVGILMQHRLPAKVQRSVYNVMIAMSRRPAAADGVGRLRGSRVRARPAGVDVCALLRRDGSGIGHVERGSWREHRLGDDGEIRVDGRRGGVCAEREEREEAEDKRGAHHGCLVRAA